MIIATTEAISGKHIVQTLGIVRDEGDGGGHGDHAGVIFAQSGSAPGMSGKHIRPGRGGVK